MSSAPIAAAQTVPVPGDVAANLEEHLRLAGAAAEAGARALVFPELSLTGYELDQADRLAFVEHDPRLEPLRDQARSGGTTLVVGAPVRLGDRLCIGAFLLFPDRSVGLYTKQHLGAFPADASPDGVVPPAEATVFQPGDRNPLLWLDGRAAAVAVCADTGRPSHPTLAAARGASVYLASMFFTPPELAGESARLQGYAKRHSMLVAMANFGGSSGGLAAGGGSAIWSPSGALLVQLGEPGSGVVLAAEDATGWRGKSFSRTAS